MSVELARPCGPPHAPTELRYGPGSAVVVLPGSPATVLNADTAQTFAAPTELVALLCRPAGWTHEDVRSAGLALDAQALQDLVTAGIVEVLAPAAALDPLALAVLRASSLDIDPADGSEGTAPPARAAAPDRPGRADVALPEPGPLGTGLGDVLAARRSTHAFAEDPMTPAELGAVLHHAARERSGGPPRSFPYAAGGAQGELSVVAVVDRVAGVTPGPYRYEAAGHALAPIATRGPAPDHPRSLAGATGGMSGTPAVRLLIVSDVPLLTARYGRRGVNIAHANAGALLQTLYLTATALGLATCAIGGAHQREDAAWLGLDPRRQYPLAYFLTGRPR